MNKKRKPFTHLNTTDDIDLGYRSTPDYLRQLAQHDSSISTELLLARNVPRTKSASEMTPRNNGKSTWLLFKVMFSGLSISL